MLSYFPKHISTKAILLYIACLLLVSVAFMSHAMDFKFILIGLIFVFSFFYISQYLTKSWNKMRPKLFARKVFFIALTIRIVWVVFSYYFYIANTGFPFEWDAADARGYHEDAEWLATAGWDALTGYLFGGAKNTSDSGYLLYLYFLYSVIGPSIIGTRLIKAIWSALTCILVYRLASRNFGDTTGKMAAIFCMLMPNLIVYCGLHLKETEMLFLVVAFIERADYLIRSRNFNFISIFLTAFLALSLFTFRTVLGAVAVVSFFIGLFFASEKVIKKGKKLLLIVLGVLFVGVVAGGTIATEVEGIWEDRANNQDAKRSMQVARGVEWAKYATGTVMAPMIFVVPFSTMVDVDEQYNQQVLHGGNFVKNFMGIFVLFAFVYLVFKNKKWRDHALLGSFVIGYLLVIALSGFANAERFHIPALPLLLIFAAYGVSQLKKSNEKYVNYWVALVLLMEFGWAFFKLGSRGIVGF